MEPKRTPVPRYLPQHHAVRSTAVAAAAAAACSNVVLRCAMWQDWSCRRSAHLYLDIYRSTMQ
jgi:glycogen synthase